MSLHTPLLLVSYLIHINLTHLGLVTLAQLASFSILMQAANGNSLLQIIHTRIYNASMGKGFASLERSEIEYVSQPAVK